MTRNLLFIFLLSALLGSCNKEEKIAFPTITFTEEFNDASLWTLEAGSIYPSGGLSPITQTAKVEGGRLLLSSKQEGGCAPARASYRFDVQRSLGTAGKFDIQVATPSFNTSSFGDLDFIMNYNGRAYQCRIKGSSSVAKMLSFTFTGDSLKLNSSEESYSISYPVTDPDGFCVKVYACGYDNFHYSEIAIESIWMVTYIEK